LSGTASHLDVLKLLNGSRIMVSYTGCPGKNGTLWADQKQCF